MAMNKILVVDDSPAHIANAREALADVGAKIITATSGREAIAKCKAEKPDLVFLDIVMDDMDGYQACRELGKDPETKDIPIVFVSTKNQRADRLWAERQGGRALISKPFEKDEILEQVKRFR